jgi:hypothetical protein
MIVATPKDAEQLENEARSIAAMICETQVDQRGELFLRVAFHLKKHTQGFQSKLFTQLAVQNGL